MITVADLTVLLENPGQRSERRLRRRLRRVDPATPLLDVVHTDAEHERRVWLPRAVAGNRYPSGGQGLLTRLGPATGLLVAGALKCGPPEDPDAHAYLVWLTADTTRVVHVLEVRAHRTRSDPLRRVDRREARSLRGLRGRLVG